MTVDISKVTEGVVTGFSGEGISKVTFGIVTTPKVVAVSKVTGGIGAGPRGIAVSKVTAGYVITGPILRGVYSRQRQYSYLRM